MLLPFFLSLYFSLLFYTNWSVCAWYGALQSCSHKCIHMHISPRLMFRYMCKLLENSAESHTKDVKREKWSKV